MVGSRGCEAGGISGLVALIEEHGEALDATLQAEYGLGLGDVTAGRVTFRRLRGLVASLPLDGTALWRAQRRGYSPDVARTADAAPPEWWTPERDLLATIADRQVLQMWQAGGAKGQRPQPMLRPGHEDGRRTYKGASLSATEFEALWASRGERADESRDPSDIHECPDGADEDSRDG